MNIPTQIYFLIVVLSYFSLPIENSDKACLNISSVEIGKKIYTTGIGQSDKKIIAIISDRKIPATMMSCINCHGNCGKGVTLQGIDIPDIRRANLIERYEVDQEGDNINKHINSKLKRTITMGLKYDGNRIHQMMPKYEMSLDDLNHLIAYLEVLGTEENCIKSD